MLPIPRALPLLLPCTSPHCSFVSDPKCFLRSNGDFDLDASLDVDDDLLDDLCWRVETIEQIHRQQYILIGPITIDISSQHNNPIPEFKIPNQFKRNRKTHSINRL